MISYIKYGWSNVYQTSEKSFGFTVDSGSGIVLIAASFGYTGAVTCNYNGSAMTQVAFQNTYGAGEKLYQFYLANPATGSHNINFQNLGTASLMVAQFNGVDLAGGGRGQDSEGVSSVVYTPNRANSFIVEACGDLNGNPSPGSPMTLIYSDGLNNRYLGMGYTQLASGAEYSHSWGVNDYRSGMGSVELYNELAPQEIANSTYKKTVKLFY
jgi:hypothetical protein